MAPDKSLAAEIEARAVKAQAGLARAYELIADQYGTWSPEAGTQFTDRGAAEAVEGIRLARELLAEISALQSRDFGDGARWMKAEALAAVEPWIVSTPAPISPSLKSRARVSSGIHTAIAALPLQPEGERNA